MAHDPRVGVAALIIRGKGDQLSVLLGHRKGSIGAGTWGFPGGHLEYGESYFDCAERETLEETGIRVENGKLVAVTNDMIPTSTTPRHYVTLYILCQAQDPAAEPEIKEPDRCGAWRFITWRDLRRGDKDDQGKRSGEPSLPLFSPIRQLLDTYPELETSLTY